MNNLVSDHGALLLLSLILGTTIVPLAILALLSLYFWARRVFFGISESEGNVTLPELMNSNEFKKHHAAAQSAASEKKAAASSS